MFRVINLFFTMLMASSVWAQYSCNSNQCNHTLTLDRAGSYIVVVSLPNERREGFWSLSVDTADTFYEGGFNGGSVLKENGEYSSWVGFSVQQTESVKVILDEYSGNVSQFSILIEKVMPDGQRLPIDGPKLTQSGQWYFTRPLPPGFYVALISSEQGSPRGRIGLSFGGQRIFGGVSGGWIDSSTGTTGEGFASFILASPQKIDLNLWFGKSYGNLGSGRPHLDVFYKNPDGSRTIYWSAPASFAPILDPANPPIDPFEFNDNPTDATPIATYPVQINATIQADIDGDYYRFPGTKGDVITAVLTKTDPHFEPILSLANELGVSLPDISLNISENSPFSAVFTTKLSVAGDYLLVVNDANSKGSPDFTYTLNIFKDMDFDGLDDEIELGLGINNQSFDSDKDGIFDAAETKGEHDIDGDTIPNWYDLDSDNDGLLDSVEGSADLDDDGLGNFMDTDSDANGLLDNQEVGPYLNHPIDSDVDSLPDYQDTDDDNDGLVDINDNDRLTPITQSNILDFDNRVFLESGIVDFGDDNTLTNAVRIGDTLLLKGEGFAMTPAENTVIFMGINGPINVTPLSVTDTELEVVVPVGATARVSMVTRNMRSNWLDLQILPDTAPVLFERDLANTAIIGETLTLTGLNLSKVTKVNFGGTLISAFDVSETSLNVIVPSDAISGNVTVTHSVWVSNPVQLKITTEISGSVVLPTRSTVELTTLTVSFGPLGKAVPDSSGKITVQVNNSNMDTLFAMLPESDSQQQAVFLQALTLQGDSSVTIDTLSTAVAMTLTGIPVIKQVALASLREVRTQVTELPEVIALASVLETALNANPYFLNDPLNAAPDYYEALFGAYEAAQTEITLLLQDGTLQSNTTRVVFDSLTEAQITEEQHDIRVFQFGDSGNVGVENDTQLYLSTQFIDSSTGSTLFAHVGSSSDDNIIGPMGGFERVFLASKKTNYGHPKWRRCQVEVVSPGILLPRGDLTIQNYLALRTFLDKVLLPVIDLAVGIKLKPKFMEELFYQYGREAVVQFTVFMAEGKVNEAFLAILNVILQDLKKLGPITQSVAKKATGGIKEVAAEKLLLIANKISAKAFPRVGQVIMAIDLGITATEVGKTVKDYTETPGLITFEVQWPLQITSVTPDVIKNEDNDIKIKIKGQGFAPIGLLGKDWVFPEVTLIDEGGSAAPVAIDFNQFIVNAINIWIEMPGEFRSNAIGPITVKVTHDGAETSEEIRVTSGVEISTVVLDSRGLLGSFVEIVGAGFSAVLIDNVVTFIKETGEILKGTIIAASKYKLIVLAPPELALSEEIEIQVEIEGEASNSVTFIQVGNEVIFDFGDNGSANDDTFALFVDGFLIHSMPSATRHAGPISLHLAEGQHSVMLRGITAPDEIGTYFINVKGNVLNITGDPQTGKDLTAGVEKHYVIEVGGRETRRSSPPLVPEGILWDE